MLTQYPRKVGRERKCLFRSEEEEEEEEERERWRERGTEGWGGIDEGTLSVTGGREGEKKRKSERRTVGREMCWLGVRVLFECLLFILSIQSKFFVYNNKTSNGVEF